jgi:thymidylate kinase
MLSMEDLNLSFIVLEGLDASGKTTQANKLASNLRKNNRVFTRFHPSDDYWAGKLARRFLLSKGRSAHFCAAIFYIIDVLNSIIHTHWQFYDYIIYVRYLMGTAYLPPPLHVFTYNFFAIFLPKPGITFFLRVNPEEARKRIANSRYQHEMFESLEQLEKINIRALSLALVNKWTIIDANKSKEEVESMIQTKLYNQLSSGAS